MQIKKWKEVKPKEKGIILFTILSILLIVGVFFYQSFAIFKANTNQDMIEGNVENMGDLEFAFYINGELSPTAPKKGSEYSFDSSSSKCIDLKTGKQVNSNITWDEEKWGAFFKGVENTKTKCFLNFKQIYKEEILNGAIPDLMNGKLVPIEIKEAQPVGITIQNMDNSSYGGKVVKADITKEWYNYKNKKWANAVILKDESITYQNNEEIPESNIESYFVWIPRYRYQLFTDIKNEYNTENASYLNLNDNSSVDTNAPIINIQFETKEEKISNGSNVGSFLTHPAFTAFNSNGMWVGKFETGTTLNDNFDVRSSASVEIKPNIYSWRDISVSNAFYTSYEYKRELESHMMKNTEWGAVAYLASSQYGLCSKEPCEKIRINNNANFITGYASSKELTCGYTDSNEECNKTEKTQLSVNGISTNNYFDIRSKVASTTNNYSGVYDMVGGTTEYVMGVIQGTNNGSKDPASGMNTTNNSGFKGPYSYCKENGGISSENCGDNLSNISGKSWPSRKYYDLYDYSTSNRAYLRGILGDGTKEFGPFRIISYSLEPNKSVRLVSNYHTDLAYFPDSYAPWFTRGGLWNDGSSAGIMVFGSERGQNFQTIGFRIVLTP